MVKKKIFKKCLGHKNVTDFTVIQFPIRFYFKQEEIYLKSAKFTPKNQVYAFCFDARDDFCPASTKRFVKFLSFSELISVFQLKFSLSAILLKPTFS